MNTEVRNWLGVLILLCLGFIVGWVTISPDVTATPQTPYVGRYQLVIGEYHFINDNLIGDEPTTQETSGKALFRIDTITGDIDMCEAAITASTADGRLRKDYIWTSITQPDYFGKKK